MPGRTIVAGGFVVTDYGRFTADLVIEGERIVAIAGDSRDLAADVRIDAAGCWVLPGGIDVHTHFREPDLETKEGFVYGGFGAAAGGVTTVVEMPQAGPTTTSAALLRANGIPAGLCYQRLSIDGTGPPFCLHGLNAVHLDQHGWVRCDARGNKPGVDAFFDPPAERLAFATNIRGERDLPEVVLALRPAPGFARRLHGRQQQRDERPDDEDHDHQFGQREAALALPATAGDRRPAAIRIGRIEHQAKD